MKQYLMRPGVIIVFLLLVMVSVWFIRTQKNNYIILTLGEDTTANETGNSPWPAQLETLLNQSGSGRRFTVVNKALPDTISSTILDQLEDTISAVKPDIVLTMIGLNDVYHPHPPTKYDRQSSRFPFPVFAATTVDSEDGLLENIKNSPDNADGYQKLGDYYDGQGLYEKAQKAFQDAIKLDPTNDNSFIGLGQAYRHLGKLDEGEKSFQQALAINSNNEMAYFNLGNIYRSRGNLAKTEEMYQKALSVNPKNDWVYIGLGYVYRERGDLIAAENAYTKAIELVPDKPLTYTELAKTNRMMNKIEQARELEAKALELFPKTARNYRLIRDILKRKHIMLVAIQYPMRQLSVLKKLLEDDTGVYYIDNENIFRDALSGSSYGEYFTDRLGGDFGRATAKGNETLAKNIATSLQNQIFDKR